MGFLAGRGGLLVEAGQLGEEWRVAGVGGDAAAGGQDPGGAVAPASGGEASKLRRVGDAAGERGFRQALAGGVMERAAGELLGAGDAGGAVFSELSNDHEESCRSFS